jgi:hypothetical protein
MLFFLIGIIGKSVNVKIIKIRKYEFIRTVLVATEAAVLKMRFYVFKKCE